jgi:DnaK suppressor protein
MDAGAEQRARQRLLALKAELEALAQSARDDSRPVELDQASVGRLSRMDAMQSQQMAQETARRRQQHLARIEVALARLEAGEYGFCFACGETIDERRLGFDPAITRCVKCAR